MLQEDEPHQSRLQNSISKELLKKTFQDLGLSRWLIDNLNDLSISNPTEIQSACIPAILNGHDVIGGAKTGSGKTASFALPILQTLSKDPYGIYGLILTPTRELAIQIAEQFHILGKNINLKYSVIIGGMDISKQAVELSNRPHIVIATPGRLAELMEMGEDTVFVKRLRYLVLDEADRLLDDSFTSSMQVIFSYLPKKRQTLLFSATITPDIEEIAFSTEKKLFTYFVNVRYETVEKLEQKYLFIPSFVKEAYLIELLKNVFENKSIIIFTGKCRTCERLRVFLRELDIKCTALHSMMQQTDRISSLAKFKGGIVDILLATDVGSRGLDIPDVEVVINYEVPASAVDYIHRVGRTARAGRAGISVTLVGERDVECVLNIEKLTKKKMEKLEISEKRVLDSLNSITEAKRKSAMTLYDKKFGKEREKNRKKKLVDLNSNGRKKRQKV